MQRKIESASINADFQSLTKVELREEEGGRKWNGNGETGWTIRINITKIKLRVRE